MITQILIIFSIFTYDVTSLQASDFYVEDLPFFPDNDYFIRMHAGYLPVNSENDGALFFWHFAKKFVGDKSRTVIWLNGGPGQSSLMGAWTEIGPFRFLNENTIVINDGSWYLYTNLLFVDQPIGTGFSYVDRGQLIEELDKMAEHFLGFLDRYVDIFPELLQQDIYLAGESFGGQYIPYIAKEILDKRLLIKLRGLLIGDGWIDPVSHYNSYLPYAVAKNLVKNDSELYTNLIHRVGACQQILSKEVNVFVEACYSIVEKIMNNGVMSERYVENARDSCINADDIRLSATKPDCGMKGPYELKYVSAYLNRPDVKSCVHVNDKKSDWKDFTESVSVAFQAFKSIPSINLLPDLLRRIPVVLYSGEYDLICNHLGTENMLDNMIWNDGTGFDLGNGTMAPIDPWIVDGEPAGLIRYARNLTYIFFYNAGHMVPYNQARRSRAMLHQFIQLNLTYPDNQTIENNSTRVNQITHLKFNYIISILFIVIITIVVLLGIIRFFVLKRQQCAMSTSFHCPNTFRSTQQSVAYSRINNMNDEFITCDDDTSV